MCCTLQTKMLFPSDRSMTSDFSSCLTSEDIRKQYCWSRRSVRLALVLSTLGMITASKSFTDLVELLKCFLLTLKENVFGNLNFDKLILVFPPYINCIDKNVPLRVMKCGSYYFIFWGSYKKWSWIFLGYGNMVWSKFIINSGGIFVSLLDSQCNAQISTALLWMFQ